uniref:Ribosomal protein S10, mitochondrial n=1 Tax=Anthurium amnicola TaxID=1678845 RepID=A0A1D1YWW0_9ARAE
MLEAAFFYRCKSLNFAQHIRCLGSRADILMKVSATDGVTKKGSWTCPKCQFINPAQSQRCLGCQEPDSISVSRSPTFGFSLGADSHNTRRVGLPQSIVKYCVLRSPHIDKKSREQFEMRIKKLYMVVKTQTDDLQKKFFWLKRQRILGAQYEIVFSYKTRLPLKPVEQECQ